MFNISTRKVRRNGLIFQVPISIFSNQRFTVHPDGTGTSWDEAAPDVNQPHGLDFRTLQDLRKGVRKRLEHEHADFADSTVGGIHLPGGCAVLGIEDGTATILADGTLKGHGLVWDNTARIWCSTATAGASTTGDWTLVLIHPDKQWGGGDITWTGAHEFDQTVDFTDIVNVDGTLETDSLVVDGTEVNIGEAAGLLLFYDPTTAYAGGESVTLPNGMILKCGTTSTPSGNPGAAADVDVSFGTAFPTKMMSVQALIYDSAATPSMRWCLAASAKTGFTIRYVEAAAAVQACGGFFWQAMGY